MADLKTKETEASVAAYLEAIADPQRQEDCRALSALMQRATGHEPRMWGPSIVGFGKYHYRYDSGHEGDACLTGFSSRKAEISVYITSGFETHQALLGRLGRHKIAKACLYLKRLSDIDLQVLEALVTASVDETQRSYPAP